MRTKKKSSVRGQRFAQAGRNRFAGRRFDRLLVGLLVGPRRAADTAGIVEGYFERQEGGREAEAVDADQQRRLDLGRPFQEPLGVARHRNPGRDEQERVHRDQRAVEVVPLEPDQDELRRRQQEEDPEQGTVIAGPRGGQGDELSQGPEGDEAEQEDRHPVTRKVLIGEESGGQPGEQDPPRPNPHPKRLHQRQIDSGLGSTALEDPHHHRGRDQQQQREADQTQRECVHGEW